MPRNLWQPGDPVGGPKIIHKVGEVEVHPILTEKGMRFTDGTNFYRKGQVSKEALPLKPKGPGKKKQVCSSNSSKPHGVKYWAPDEWANGKIPSVKNKR